MVKKKKKVSITGLAVGGSLSTAVVSSLPNPTNSSAITGLKSGYAGGISTVGNAIPTIASINVTNQKIGLLGKLKKKVKKFN